MRTIERKIDMNINETTTKVAMAALAGYGLGTIAVKITSKFLPVANKGKQDVGYNESAIACAVDAFGRLNDALEDPDVSKRELFEMYNSELEWLAMVMLEDQN